MTRIVTGLLIAMTIVCVSNLARAQDDLAPRDDFSRAGCYLGASGTVAFPMSDEYGWQVNDYEFTDPDVTADLSVSADVSESLGLHARAGCRGGWGGGELHFEWLEEFGSDGAKVEVDDFEVLNPKTKVDGWALTLDGKLYPLWALEDRLPPLARRFQPFATVGFGYLTRTMRATATVLLPVDDAVVEKRLSVEDDDWDFAVRFGGGLEIYLTRNIAINVDTTYVLPVSDALEDFDYLSVGWGVLYRF